jgi:lipopolysaccharide cholinephosphotransferase
MENKVKNRERQLRIVHHLEVLILKEVVRICDNHKLTYYISGGTFLGAVRHNGFIPWDDDVDIALPRRDYDQLLELLPGELPSHLRLVSFSNTSGYNKLYAQVQDQRVQVEILLHRPPIVTPCWIDVFPLDGAPEPGIRRAVWRARLELLEGVWGLSRIDEAWDEHSTRSAARATFIRAAKHLHTERILNVKRISKRRENILRKYSTRYTNYYVNTLGAYKFNSIFSRDEIYGDGAYYDFEQLRLRGPKNFEKYLSRIYGDYMQLPPESERNNWHGTEVLSRKTYIVGYTQGTFDMFHIGHLNLLHTAKQFCDYLIVGVNSDHLVESYKNKSPVIGCAERCKIIESVRCVDECVVADTLDKTKVAGSIPFDVVFIGDDWIEDPRWIQTKAELKKLDIDVMFLPHTSGVSSTALRKDQERRIRD